MSLVTYEETRPWAKAIKERVVTRQMPPWHLDKTVGIQDFQNDISLSDGQIAMIAHWVDCGRSSRRPQGHACSQRVAEERWLATGQTVWSRRISF